MVMALYSQTGSHMPQPSQIISFTAAMMPWVSRNCFEMMVIALAAAPDA